MAELIFDWLTIVCFFSPAVLGVYDEIKECKQKDGKIIIERYTYD